MTVLIEEEFDSAGVPVSRQLPDAQGGLSHTLAQFLIDDGRRAFFHHLLMPSLQRTFAFTEMNQVAVLVAENLDLDVAGAVEVFLDVDPRVVKGILRFRSRRAVGGGEFGLRTDETQPLAAPSGGGLEHDREAGLVRDATGFLQAFQVVVRPGNDRQARLESERALTRSWSPSFPSRPRAVR